MCLCAVETALRDLHGRLGICNCKGASGPASSSSTTVLVYALRCVTFLLDLCQGVLAEVAKQWLGAG